MALFIALGGVSYAAVTLPKDSVGTRQIKDGQVKAADPRAGDHHRGPVHRRGRR